MQIFLNVNILHYHEHHNELLTENDKRKKKLKSDFLNYFIKQNNRHYLYTSGFLFQISLITLSTFSYSTGTQIFSTL